MIFSNRLISELPILLINHAQSQHKKEQEEKTEKSEKMEKMGVKEKDYEACEGFSICQSDITLPLNIINNVS